jgi:hypothetical protein
LVAIGGTGVIGNASQFLVWSSMTIRYLWS